MSQACRDAIVSMTKFGVVLLVLLSLVLLSYSAWKPPMCDRKQGKRTTPNDLIDRHILVKGYSFMRKIMEYTLVSADGVFTGADISAFSNYRDDAYMQDGLEQALMCDAMLMGRNTYEGFAKIWPARTDPWAKRINALRKYVFSSTLEKAEWNNSTIIRGDVVAEVTRLKQQDGQDLLIYGHGLLGETLLKHHLLDILGLTIHPLIIGQGKHILLKSDTIKLKLVTAKSFPKGIVKLTYKPQY
jgi:dihydrofolate reductase